MSKRDVQLYIDDIVESANAIKSYVEDLNYEELDQLLREIQSCK